MDGFGVNIYSPILCNDLFLSHIIAGLFMAPWPYDHANINIFYSMQNPNVVI